MKWWITWDPSRKAKKACTAGADRYRWYARIGSLTISIKWRSKP